ncbi:phage tail protein [Oceanicella sp. SM1341]|uniref:phage tail protein n=1 Tax=Oceanicella sp. SM1341 TaxID=1548889 RepID=UPI000E54DDEB|nr:phage tail protein [Oceanicella sp. SM1341]
MAKAVPIITSVAAIAATVFIPGGVGILGATVSYGAIAAAGISVAGGLAATALAETPSQQVPQTKVSSEAAVTNPSMRFAYGACDVLPVQLFRHVDGATYYGVYLLNSRPSEGGFVLKVNDEVQTLGAAGGADPYDFDQGGLVSTGKYAARDGDGPIKVWFSRGDHTGPPPQWLEEIPEAISETDVWAGMTLMFVRLRYGGATTASRLWKGRFPAFRVFGYWSKLYDPRDPAQDSDDAATWRWSDNAALATLDLLRHPRALGRAAFLVDWPSFAEAADDCEITGREYRVNGVVTLETREYSLLDPVLTACGGRLSREGGVHRLRVAKWRDPVMTLTTPLGESFEFTEQGPAYALASGVVSTFVSAELGYVADQVPDYVTGAGDDRDRLEFPLVTDWQQVERLQQIAQRASLRQARFSDALFPASAMRVRVGDFVTLAIPGFGIANGVYEVLAKRPQVIRNDQGSAMLVVGLELAETGPEVFDWNPATDLMPYTVSESAEQVGITISPPGVAAAPVFRKVETGGTAIDDPVLALQLTASPAPFVDHYQVRQRELGGRWRVVLEVEAAEFEAGVLEVILPATLGFTYETGARAVSDIGASPWANTGAVTVTPEAATLSPPYGGRDEHGAPGTAAVSFIVPPNAAGLSFYRVGTGLLEALEGEPGARVTFTEALGPGAYTYTARAQNALGDLSGASAQIRITVASGGGD